MSVTVSDRATGPLGRMVPWTLTARAEARSETASSAPRPGTVQAAQGAPDVHVAQAPQAGHGYGILAGVPVSLRRKQPPGQRRSPVSGVASERGSGTVLAAGLGMVVVMVMSLLLLLAQASAAASKAAAAADLAALAAADALRGVSAGEPCLVAAAVAARHKATLVSCTAGGDQSVEVSTELPAGPLLGVATGRARAGPPP